MFTGPCSRSRKSDGVSMVQYSVKHRLCEVGHLFKHDAVA